MERLETLSKNQCRLLTTLLYSKDPMPMGEAAKEVFPGKKYARNELGKDVRVLERYELVRRERIGHTRVNLHLTEGGKKVAIDIKDIKSELSIFYTTQPENPFAAAG